MNLWVGTPHGKSPPAKFGGRRHCGSGDMMLLVVAEQDSSCFCVNPPLWFISKAHGMKTRGMPFDKFSPGHTLSG